MPKISVIIPVYNTEKYLRKCLDSVINQTLKDIEIICVNDGSTDGSLAILNEYAQKDNRIIVIDKENTGAGDSRNVGISYVTSDYLTFLDSDDWLDENALYNFYKKVEENNNYDVILAQSCNYIKELHEFKPRPYSLKLSLLKNLNVFSSDDIPDYIFTITTPDVWGKLFKLSFIRNNNIKFQNLKTCNDVYFIFKSLMLAQKITYIKNVVVFWRVNNLGSITSTRYKYTENWIINYNLLKKDLITYNKRNLSNSLVEAFINVARYELNRINDSKSIYKYLFILKMIKYLSFSDLIMFTKRLFLMKYMILFKILFS